MHCKDNIRQTLKSNLSDSTEPYLEKAINAIVSVKKSGGKVAVVVGSGPNIHEGVTTLIAELIDKGLIDGVITSSAVISHEMSGALDRVHRVRWEDLNDPDLPKARDSFLEATVLDEESLQSIEKEFKFDRNYYQALMNIPGKEIIKAAGNMGYPMGLRTETLAREIQSLAVSAGVPFEALAGFGADERTMLGAASRNNIPMLVGVPQLIGGGAVGLAVGDSLPITERSTRVAKILAEADVIIESAVALTQEIHDGPFETYTGHGIWSQRQGHWSFSLEGKTLIRIDLDPNLLQAWQYERDSGTVSKAIENGLPKTKLMKVPFRMEMSGFARLPGSIPVVGDIGVIWPLMADAISQSLGIELDFIGYPQSTPEGQEMRDWIVENIKPASRDKLLRGYRRILEGKL